MDLDCIADRDREFMRLWAIHMADASCAVAQAEEGDVVADHPPDATAAEVVVRPLSHPDGREQQFSWIRILPEAAVPGRRPADVHGAGGHSHPQGRGVHRGRPIHRGHHHPGGSRLHIHNQLRLRAPARTGWCAPLLCHVVITGCE